MSSRNSDIVDLISRFYIATARHIEAHDPKTAAQLVQRAKDGHMNPKLFAQDLAGQQILDRKAA